MVAFASTSFSILAAISLVFACEFSFWHNLPVGFEGTLAYGAISFMSGVVFSFLSFVLAVIYARRKGLTGPHLVLCSWTAALLLACGIIFLYAP